MPRQSTMDKKQRAEVGARIRSIRERRGLSQRQLSLVAGAGCTPAYISRIESGDRAPSLNVLEAIAAGLQVDESFLRTGSIENVVVTAFVIEDFMEFLEAEEIDPM